MQGDSLRNWLIPLLGCLCFQVNATHDRAGEITYRVISYLTFEVSVTIYTLEPAIPPTDSIDISWGDGDTVTIPRSNATGEFLSADIKKSIYIGRHTYPGSLPFYIISVFDPNRIGNIININNGNSVNIQFYVEDTLRIFDPSFIGSNNSPILLYPPIDFACIDDTFYHNPTAFDPDGDSLSYELVAPLMGTGAEVPNYDYPDQIEPGINNQFTINPVTGEIRWATPRRPGTYNIAILITEYRNGIRMGTVLRDMQIIVTDCNNRPPRIAEFADTCVVAGTLLQQTITATDPNGHAVILTAQGGPLYQNFSPSPATFTAQVPSNPVSGFFEWQTDCHHVRTQFYSVVFKAEDNYSVPLVDLKTWLIHVVAPAPENLQAAVLGKDITLTWAQPYHCDSISDFIGFSVWRKENSNPFIPAHCETGLAGKGYAKIAGRIMDYNYTDTDVTAGKVYCYRILAEFARKTQAGLYYNKVESLPSNETCAELRIDLPLIKNVSVLETNSAAGKIFVAWYRPKTDSNNLDTLQLTGPYSFKLYRSTGFSGANPALVAIYSNQYFSNLLDTTFVDTLLNTIDNAYSYQVEFYSNGNLLISESASASSVFLAIASSSGRLELSWQENVPWQNFSYVVYRKNSFGFDSIAVTSSQTFIDEGLENDTEYCYHVKSAGEYSSMALNDILLNLSQQVCAVPIDNEAPCAPVLEVASPCSGENQKDICSLEDTPANELSWVASSNFLCAENIALFNIHYSPDSQTSFVKIGNTTGNNFFHRIENSLAGCYAVTAIDSIGNESAYSNTVCVENCYCYELPNVFTPNNDAHNDYYTPIKPYRFVEKIDMKIYNRWGTLVFETTDPEIRWNGRDINNNKPVAEGVYYYVCTVEDTRLNGSAKNPNILSGFIHLIRGMSIN